MEGISKSYHSDLDGIEEALQFAVADMKPHHIELWHLKQLCLTEVILGRIAERISELQIDDSEKERLKANILLIGKLALPDFFKGMAANPVHHNFQTAENILRILADSGTPPPDDFETYNTAAILALLHDIGNGYVPKGLKKVKSSDIADRQRELKEEGKSPAEISEAVRPLIEEGKRYRKAHMIAGARVATELLKEANKEYAVVSPDDVSRIASVIAIHDNPSIVEYDSKAGQPYDLGHLIPIHDELAYRLREADRLWMVSQEGLEKDLFDDLRKGNTPDPFNKLRGNVKRFRDEYKLYENAVGITRLDREGFQDKTLFRTKGGYNLCKEYVEVWMKRLGNECLPGLFPAE